jgi:hypothetical protein
MTGYCKILRDGYTLLHNLKIAIAAAEGNAMHILSRDLHAIGL